MKRKLIALFVLLGSVGLAQAEEDIEIIVFDAQPAMASGQSIETHPFVARKASDNQRFSQ
jgi:hypothetical protein